ncbi:ComEC/Rec2 family competence protein [Roseitalea porphyridii]|uniref:ComEC family competence protein n=1 Tax=Roseitalea porphyridii TaxID=1852022 RepID=A0A4P6V2L6_9HYPH|nr:ComEC/Rec2 family competence protein [Roseitalea porphyridii]QBK30680.1 ComEC family competence protein [Roseitalea porphyridii]
MAGPGETTTRKRRGWEPVADETAAPAECRAFLHAPAIPKRPTSAEKRAERTAAEIPAPAPAAPSPRARPRLQALRARWTAHLARALDDEAAFGTPFLLVPVLLLVGVAGYFALPAEPAAHNLPLALGFCALLWHIARSRSRPVARVLLTGVLLLAGMALAQWHTMAQATQMLGAEVTTHLTGRIVRMEQRPDGSVRYTLDVLATERPRLRHVPDRLRVTARVPVSDVRAGDGLKGVARLFPLSGPARPGGYDFTFHGYFAGHGANGFFYGAPEKVAAPPPDGWRAAVAARLQNARLWLGQRIRAAAPGEAGTVAAALVNGDKSAIPEPVNEALRISGLAHILTISGLHMALVAGTVMIGLRAGLALSGPLVAGHAVKKHAALVALAAIFVYLFMAGAGVATQRSFTMLAVMLAALLLDRRAISKRNLAIAAIVIIALHPAAVVGPSFHMSFAATLALIALYDLWNRRRAERASRSPAKPRPEGIAAAGSGAFRFFVALAATSLVAGAASGLYAAYHFQRVAVLGLVTNLAAMPIVSLITMPLAILATLAIPFGVDGPLYAMMAASAGWILAIAQWVAARSPDGMVGAMSNAAMLWATAAMVWFCVCRTWLRWGAVLPALAATMFMGQRDLPLAVISEDGRQMAVVGTSGALAVNRARPNAFIVEQWQQAYAARTVIKPVGLEDGVAEWVLPDAAAAVPAHRAADAEPGGRRAQGADPVAPMRCAEQICIATVWRGAERYDLVILSAPFPDGPTNATAETGGLKAIDAEAHDGGHHHASVLCGRFDLIVLAYAPAESPCDDGTLVLTARDLAFAGSAEIRPAPRGRLRTRENGTAPDPPHETRLSQETAPQTRSESERLEAEAGTAKKSGAVSPRLAVRHAVSTPLRPWHDARRWSRAARNLAPY